MNLSHPFSNGPTKRIWVWLVIFVLCCGYIKTLRFFWKKTKKKNDLGFLLMFCSLN